jgi:protein ImuA
METCMSRAWSGSQPTEGDRLGSLRREIAGLAAPAHQWPDAAARIRLGHASLDHMLGGGLKPGALYEIVAARYGDLPAAAGFALALARALRGTRKPIIWIGEEFAALEQGDLYGPGLAFHGMDLDDLLLVRAAHAKQALWAMEEALKCRAPGLVIGEIFSAKFYDLAASRRLVLAAQRHATPALLFLAGIAGTERLSSGADARFEVRARSSLQQASAAHRLPLPGSSAWSVRIAKARAGPAGFAVDRDLFHPVFWTESKFRDALSIPVSAVAGDGPDHSPRNARRALGA